MDDYEAIRDERPKVKQQNSLLHSFKQFYGLKLASVVRLYGGFHPANVSSARGRLIITRINAKGITFGLILP